MKQCAIVYDAQVFTSTPPEQKVNFPNLIKASLGYEFLGTGTTASTVATVIATITEVKVKVGGETVTTIRGDDLFALNYVERIRRILGEKPQYLMSTTADNTNGFLKIGVPLGITSDKDVYIQPTFNAAPANTDNGTLTITADYGDLPIKEPPFRLTYISQNTQAGPGFASYDFNNSGHKLIGLLIFSTTVAPGSSVKDASAGYVKLVQNTHDKIIKNWFNMESPESYIENTVLQAILTKYRYIDLWDDPIPADQLKIQVHSIATATDACRFIGIFR